MLNVTTQQVKEALESGINCILAPNSDFIILRSDGSVRDKQDKFIEGPDSVRAALYATHAARAAQKEELITNHADIMLLAANIAPYVIVLKGGIAAAAPTVGDYAVGDKYFNSVSNKLYMVMAGNPNTWEDMSAAPIQSNLLLYATDDGLYRYNGTTLVALGVDAVE